MTQISSSLSAAAKTIRSGGVVLCPTEGVYGLSCDATCLQAVRRIISLKQRDVCMGLILIAADIKALEGTADCSSLGPRSRALMRRLWPGPFTFVLPAVKGLSVELCGGRPTVAVRVSDFSTLKDLCSLSHTLLVSTSANISGKPAVSEFSALDTVILNGTDLVLAQPCGGLKAPTAIYDTVHETLVRRGPGWPD